MKNRLAIMDKKKKKSRDIRCHKSIFFFLLPMGGRGGAKLGQIPPARVYSKNLSNIELNESPKNVKILMKIQRLGAFERRGKWFFFF